MFPINIFYYPKNKARHFNRKENNILKVPVGIDPYQYEVKVDDKYNYILNKIQDAVKYELSNNNIEGRTFCFYCGTKTSNIVPGFLHDGSGLNLWIYSDWRCSSVICETCCNYAGKLNVIYKRKVLEVPSNIQNIPTQLLKFEPDIIIPGLEAAHKHFKFSIDGRLIAITQRAVQTIERFALNRKELVYRRLEVINENDLSKSMNNLNNFSLLDVSPVDCMFLKSFLEDKVSSSDIIESYSKYLHTKSNLYVEPELIYKVDRKLPHKKISFVEINSKSRQSGKVYTSSPTIESFSFSGIRGFANDLLLEFDGKRTILMLGENGVGKSTLLELFRQAFMSRAKLSMDGLADEPNTNPYFKVEYSDINSYFLYSADGNVKGKRLASNVVVIPELRISESKINNFVTWIQDISDDKDLINWISRKLKILLNLPQDYEFIANKESIYWISRENVGKRFYLEHFSSGYRSLMTIFHAIISKLTYKNKIDNLPILEQGLLHSTVLIDEIELHLHPIFKKQIVKTIKEVFPGVLFIMTTHDPLIIKSADENVGIIVLNKVDGKTYIQSELPDHTNLTTEQILTSQIFGLSTTENNEVKQSRVNDYYKAIKNKEWDIVDKLREQLTDVGFFGTTYRELISLSAVDAYLAKQEVPLIENIIDVLARIDKKDA